MIALRLVKFHLTPDLVSVDADALVTSYRAHLEPDQVYGHRWLEALRDAVVA